MTYPPEEIDEFDEASDPREQMLGWARAEDGRAVSEGAVPSALSTRLAERRTEHPDQQLQVLAFRVLRDGVEVGRVGPERPVESFHDMVAISVVETTADRTGLHVDAFVLAVREGRSGS